MSRCVAYQAGGFGRWGRMMSYNSSCWYFLKPGRPEICPRPKKNHHHGSSNIHDDNCTQEEKHPIKSLMFLPPMPTEKHQDLQSEEQ
jgi:hypothetical protein